MSVFKADSHFVEENDIEWGLAASDTESSDDYTYQPYVSKLHIWVTCRDGTQRMTPHRVGTRAEHCYFRVINEYGKHFFESEADYRNLSKQAV